LTNLCKKTLKTKPLANFFAKILERKGFDKTEAKFWRKGLGKIGRFFVEKIHKTFGNKSFLKNR
jgi:hypothetical protein